MLPFISFNELMLRTNLTRTKLIGSWQTLFQKGNSAQKVT
jgi:hypothetical protein